jgi:hypothetical protein
MKKFLIIIVIFVAPFISVAQNAVIDSAKEAKTEVAIKKVEQISVNPKTQNLDLNYKKSNDIISIKAYIKSLQLKRKATLNS